MVDLASVFSLLMFPALFLLIAIGVPVAFAMVIVAFFFLAIHFNYTDAVISIFVQKIDEIATNYTLAAVPLFIFMGTILERSGLAEKLFDALRLWTGRIPGGLAVTTVAMCVVFAAASGIVGATETVVGLLAIPIMMRYKYSNDLIAGTICAGGSLGTIIPPSVVIVILGPVANVDVGALFMAVLIPGLMLAAVYIVYIIVRCSLFPEHGPRADVGVRDVGLVKLVRKTFVALVPPLLVVFSVLGTLMLGWATPTEAAAMGALSSLLLTISLGRLKVRDFWTALHRTLLVTTMILTILLAGSLFAAVFAVSGGLSVVEQILESAGLTAVGTLLLVLTIAFLAGFVLDLVSIILIIVPIAVPLLQNMSIAGLEPADMRLWFCVLIMIIIQTSYITPPMAPAIFYLRGIAPPELKLVQMYRGVVPFVLLQLFVALLVALFPDLALWLPEQVSNMRAW